MARQRMPGTDAGGEIVDAVEAVLDPGVVGAAYPAFLGVTVGATLLASLLEA
jgi:hypothetical protein